MSGKLKLATMVVALGGAISCNAWGIEFPYMLQDPLLTRPDILNQGVTLPGDGAPLACIPLNAESQSLKGPLALETAVDMALCHNPQVKAAWAAIKEIGRAHV